MDGGLRRVYMIVDSCTDDRITMWMGCGGDDSMGSREKIMRRAHVMDDAYRGVYTMGIYICTYIRIHREFYHMHINDICICMVCKGTE